MGQTGLSVPAPNTLDVEIRMRTSTSSGDQLFYMTEDAPYWSKEKSAKFDVTGGEWRTYTVELPPRDSSVTGLRLDPSAGRPPWRWTTCVSTTDLVSGKTGPHCPPNNPDDDIQQCYRYTDATT